MSCCVNMVGSEALNKLEMVIDLYTLCKEKRYVILVHNVYFNFREILWTIRLKR